MQSDRDSEEGKNHSDVDEKASTCDKAIHSNSNNDDDDPPLLTRKSSSGFENGYHHHVEHHQQEYDSGTTATVSSPEPEEYTYEGAIRGYVSRVSQNIPRRSLPANFEAATKPPELKPTIIGDETDEQVVKIDISKRREIFEKAAQQSNVDKVNRLEELANGKSIKERLSSLENNKQQNHEECNVAVGEAKNAVKRLSSGDVGSIRDRFAHLEQSNGQTTGKLTIVERFSDSTGAMNSNSNGNKDESSQEMIPKLSIKERLVALEHNHEERQHKQEMNKRAQQQQQQSVNAKVTYFGDQPINDNGALSSPSEKSSSPDSEYREDRAPYYRSMESLEADASSGPDTFDNNMECMRRYPTTMTTTAVESLTDNDREDSGINTADVSCAVSQADEEMELTKSAERQQQVNRCEETQQQPTLVCRDSSKPMQEITNKVSPYAFAESFAPSGYYSSIE